MRITDLRVVVTNPGRNFVTAVVETDEGISGLGDAKLNGRELSVAAHLSEHVAPMLRGGDAFAIEDTWQLMARSSYWRRGPVQTAAQSAIDMALWDIRGKALGVPVYQLLGGRCRKGVMAYAHASGFEISEALDELNDFIENGYRAVRLQCGVPGILDVYGVDRMSPITMSASRNGRCTRPRRTRFSGAHTHSRMGTSTRARRPASVSSSMRNSPRGMSSSGRICPSRACATAL